jgi:NADH-quinone oxidoreductase subunit M
LQRVWLGPPNEKYLGLAEVDARELVTLVPLAAIVIVLGVYPHAVLDLINVALLQLNDTVMAHGAGPVATR